MSNITTTTDRLALVRTLRNAICMVEFKKLNGEVTRRIVTLNTTCTPSMSDRTRAALDMEFDGADLQNPRANIVVWDTQEKHLISFYAERVVEFYPILDIG